MFASAAAFLTSTVAVTSSAGAPQAADGEVLDGAQRLDAVVDVGRNLALAERIAFECVSSPDPGPLKESRLAVLYSPACGPAFFDSVLELVIKTSTDLPPDVRPAMGRALETETPGTQSAQALTIIAANIDMAADDEGPICQDTGMPTFVITAPVGANQALDGEAHPRGAIAEATRRGQAAAELGRFADREEQRQQPRARDARHPLRASGRARTRSRSGCC